MASSPAVKDQNKFGFPCSSTILPHMECPIIELERLLDVSSPIGKQELLKLSAAITSWGCFQLVNHGVKRSLIDRVHIVGKEFFALPEEEKQSYNFNEYEGYADGESIIWNYRLRFLIHPVEQRNLKYWPEQNIVSNFRETLDEYSIEVKRVLEEMLKAIAKSLNLEENIFLREFGNDGLCYARFNYYPECPNPDKNFGLGPHSDAPLLTILLQDEQVEGLQVFHDNQWYKVPFISDAIFINIGDQLEILSNGILKSVIHRAVTNKENERMSMAVAVTLHPDKEIGPLKELIDENRPKLYKNVTNYFGKVGQSYAKRERLLDTLKICNEPTV